MPVISLIQRLGYWIQYNLKSAISEAEWNQLRIYKLPELKGKITVGIKYGKDGENAALSIAVKTTDDKVFVESVDCRPTRAGNGWIIEFLRAADAHKVIVDGANGQQLLVADMKEAKLKTPVLPTVKEIISANAMFEQAVWSEGICHMGAAVAYTVSEQLLEAAYWIKWRIWIQVNKRRGGGCLAGQRDTCALGNQYTFKEKKKQRISY